jgi:hypothetical protein
VANLAPLAGRRPVRHSHQLKRCGVQTSIRFPFLPAIGLSPPVTEDPAVVWKYGRLYVWLPWVNRGPRLAGRLRPSGQGVEIVGRAGADDISLVAAIAMETVIFSGLLNIGPLGSLLWALPLVSAVIFLWKRSSPNGGRLVGFLAHLLDAEDVLARKGHVVFRFRR